MPPVAEHHVANDQEAPFVADHFERQIDRAAGAFAHTLSVPRVRCGTKVLLPRSGAKTACNIAPVIPSYNQLQNTSSLERRHGQADHVEPDDARWLCRR